jgi:hypothetical protein
MNIIQLLQDYSIPYHTEGFKYCRPGWVNIECPFCTGNPGPHMGIEIDHPHCNCWRCGWHPLDLTISKLLNIPLHEIKTILKNYGGSFVVNSPKVKIRKKTFKFPSGTTHLQINHKQYLEKRRFDPDKLEYDWGLLGTNPVSTLDKISYKHRIIIPFYWDDKIVSFDSRDITNKTDVRYKACPKERELIPHKDIIYGKQKHWGKTGICVEGPTDVWRLGFNSFCVSGIKYTPKQVRLMVSLFRRIMVVFDDDPQAIIQANLLVSELKFRGCDAKRIDIIGDPGEMDQSEADYLVKQLIT